MFRVLGAGCFGFNRTFECADDSQCGAGSCEGAGFCAFDDGECPSGKRYGDLAGGLSGSCVGETTGDGGIDAMVGDGGSIDGGPFVCADPTGSAAPTPPTSWTKIAPGRDHTCAMAADDTVWCWGRNQLGQIGDGTTELRLVPRQVPGVTGVSWIAAGDDHTCVLLGDKTMRCWGDNSKGQLGHNSTDAFSSTPVTPLTSDRRWMFAGGRETCASLLGGAGWQCWGDNGAKQLGAPAAGAVERAPVTNEGGWSSAAEISVGGEHVCGEAGATQVSCLGQNDEGQLDGTPSAPSVTALATTVGQPILSVAAGGQFSCAIGGFPAVTHCWGANDRDQIGVNSVETRLPKTPVAVPATWQAEDFFQNKVMAGSNHGCMVGNTNPSVLHGFFCWGDNTKGQVGIGSTALTVPIPTIVTLPTTGPSDHAAGTDHTCVIHDGTLRCWGANDYGQLGTGDCDPHNEPVVVLDGN